jgi:hypothetical protein
MKEGFGPRKVSKKKKKKDKMKNISLFSQKRMGKFDS